MSEVFGTRRERINGELLVGNDPTLLITGVHISSDKAGICEQDSGADLTNVHRPQHNQTRTGFKVFFNRTRLWRAIFHPSSYQVLKLGVSVGPFKGHPDPACLCSRALSSGQAELLNCVRSFFGNLGPIWTNIIPSICCNLYPQQIF